MAIKKGLGRGLDALIRPAEKKNSASPVPEETKGTQNSNAKSSGKITNNSKPKADDKTSPKNDQKTESLKENQAKPDNENNNGNSENYIKITSIEPNRTQPRKNFDEDALSELAESIKQYGILQPLLVSKKKDYYEIIAGERRWRAAKMAGLKEVPVIIKELNDQERVEISLIENIQREDLNPIEEAQAYKRLLEEFSLKQDEIAERVFKSRTAVTNSMRLLKLDEKVQQMLIDDMITAGHARALLSLPSSEKQAELAMKIFDEKLSVRETERLVKNMLTPPKKTERVVYRDFTQDAIFENLEERMKGILGTKVNIQRKKNNKGKIEIEYYSMEELERITDLLNTIG